MKCDDDYPWVVGEYGCLAGLGACSNMTAAAEAGIALRGSDAADRGAGHGEAGAVQAAR